MGKDKKKRSREKSRSSDRHRRDSARSLGERLHFLEGEIRRLRFRSIIVSRREYSAVRPLSRSGRLRARSPIQTNRPHSSISGASSYSTVASKPSGPRSGTPDEYSDLRIFLRDDSASEQDVEDIFSCHHKMLRCWKTAHLILLYQWVFAQSLGETTEPVKTFELHPVLQGRWSLTSGNGLDKEETKERKKKLPKGSIEAYQRGKVMALKWQDKKLVCAISNVHNPETDVARLKKNEGSIKPKLIIDYNNTMGGVDRADQELSYESTRKQQKKYYKKVFCHLMDQSVYNSFVLFQKVNRTVISLLEFSI